MIRAKAYNVADCKIKARVPMNDDEDVEYKLTNSENKWKIGSALGAVKELGEPVKSEQPIKANYYGTRNSIRQTTRQHEEIGKVGWKQTNEVQLEGVTFHVMFSELLGVSNQYALFQVASARVRKHVEQVNQVAKVVEQVPG